LFSGGLFVVKNTVIFSATDADSHNNSANASKSYCPESG
jgi:hypothetical protein